MSLVSYDEAMLCRALLSTLVDKALILFSSLKENSIDSWSTIETKFYGQICTIDAIPKTRDDLANVKQKEDKTLLVYIDHFKKVLDEIEGLSDDTVLTCFEGDSSPGP